MTISAVFKSTGHFLATVFQKALPTINKIEKTEGTVETVTAAVGGTYGPLALTVEKAAYAVLGEVASVLVSSDAASKAKLADSGLDVNVISTVEALLKDIPQFVALITKL